MPKIAPDVIAAAQAAEAKWGIPASIQLAQYGDESGWGADMPPGSNNPFGIKALHALPSVEAATVEIIHGRATPTDAEFAVFPSIAAAFDAHAKLLALSAYYVKARACLPNVAAFCNALTGVYASDLRYGPKLNAIIADDNLTQYDAPPAPKPKLVPTASIPPAPAPTPTSGAKTVSDTASAAPASAPATFATSKPTMASLTVHGGLAAITGGVISFVSPLLPLFGFTTDQDAKIVAALGAVATVYGGVMAIIGRFKATTTLT